MLLRTFYITRWRSLDIRYSASNICRVSHFRWWQCERKKRVNFGDGREGKKVTNLLSDARTTLNYLLFALRAMNIIINRTLFFLTRRHQRLSRLSMSNVFNTFFSLLYFAKAFLFTCVSFVDRKSLFALLCCALQAINRFLPPRNNEKNIFEFSCFFSNEIQGQRRQCQLQIDIENSKLGEKFFRHSCFQRNAFGGDSSSSKITFTMSQLRRQFRHFRWWFPSFFPLSLKTHSSLRGKKKAC